jgi:hypothetical protein
LSLLHNVPESTHEGIDNRDEGLTPRGRRGKGRGEPPAPTSTGTPNTGGSLTRITANFTPRAMGALDTISAKTGDSRTDTLNISVMLYEAILELLERGDGKTLHVKHPDGTEERLRLVR